MTMDRRKQILVLMNHQSFSPCFPRIAEYATRHNWALTIEDRLAPPFGWTGDGAITELLAHPEMMRFRRYLADKRIPSVDLNNAIARANGYFVTPDFRAVGALAARHFDERGFRNRAWFSLIWTRIHEQICREFTARSGGDVLSWVVQRESAHHPAGYDRARLMNTLRRRLQDAPKPLAVLCYDTYNATFVIEACAELGLSVPGDVAILAGNNVEHLALTQSVPLSAVRLDDDAKIDRALETLDALTDGRRPAARTVLIPPLGVAARASTDTMTADHPRLAQALRFVMEHLAEPIRAADVAAATELPRSTLDNLFAHRLGRSVGAEILRQRILRAQNLLRDTDEKLESIAARTGFCHASHLIRAFRRATGQTPSDWRSERPRRQH